MSASPEPRRTAPQDDGDLGFLPPFKKHAELDEAEKAERAALVNFAQDLCKSILQTSIYTIDHPQARAGVERAMRGLDELGGRWDEFTFIVSHWKEEEGMALEGIFNEPVPLVELIGGAAGESFDRKLNTFCRRNKVVSFSIKNTIDSEEFHRFIAVFVEFHVAQETQQLMSDYGAERAEIDFTDKLLARGVVNVPVVMEKDLVESKRRIPWRVRVALARLKKDLRSIPIYANATAMQLRDAKLRILRDILRPLRKQLHLRDLFLNLDLIMEAVEELQGVDLERDLCEALPRERIVVLGQSLMIERKRVHEPHYDPEDFGYPADQAEVIDRQLSRLGDRVSEIRHIEGAAELLRGLYVAEVIELGLLPKDMQDSIRIELWTVEYLKEPDDFLDRADRAFTAEEYLEEIPKVLAIFPNLIRLHKYGDTSRMLDLIGRHKASDGLFPGRRILIDEALEVMHNEEAVRLLVHEMLTETALVREYLKKLFIILGPPSIPTLLKVLEASPPRDVVDAVGLTLVAMGEAAIRPIEDLLGEGGLGLNTARTLLTALGEVGGPAVTDTLQRYVRHPRPAVREAALRALYGAVGEQSASWLVQALDDTERRVILRAIQLLERIGHDRTSYSRRLARFLNPDHEDSKIDPVVVEAACRELGRIGNADLQELGTVEEQLIRCFDRYGQSKMSSLLRRPRDEHAERIRSIICEVLGRIGTDLAAERLEDASDEPSPLIKGLMARTVEAIDRRQIWDDPA